MPLSDALLTIKVLSGELHNLNISNGRLLDPEEEQLHEPCDVAKAHPPEAAVAFILNDFSEDAAKRSAAKLMSHPAPKLIKSPYLDTT